MTNCSSASCFGRACGLALAAAFSIALPLALSSGAHAQRHGGGAGMQHGPGVMPSQRMPGGMMQQHMGPMQGSLRSEFRTALEPHGQWRQHARWGDVWIPGNRPQGWRPYTVGRWAYTNDWGWYWVADDVEAPWGVVAYHYGRWVLDEEVGWCWIPGEEWGPAWVQWRRPQADVEYVGWAPLPPDQVTVEYQSQPEYWTFVRGTDFVAPRLVSVILPPQRYETFFQETVLVNRTVFVNDRGAFGVNPGIAPSFIAAATHQPLRTFDVRPVVLAGTAAFAGAMQVRAQDLRREGFARAALQPTQNVVRAADRVGPAQPLAPGERGRFGDMPPRAVQRDMHSPATTGRGPESTPQGQPMPQQSRQTPATMGRGPGNTPQGQPMPQQFQQPSLQGRGRTPPDLGQAGRQQQGLQDRRGVSPQLQPQHPQHQQTSQPRPATEGRGLVEQPRGSLGEREGARPQVQQQHQPQQQHEQQQQHQQQQQRAMQPQRPNTEGRGTPEPRSAMPSERRTVSPVERSASPQVRAPAVQHQPMTEGRGGGGSPAARMPGGGMEGHGGGGMPGGAAAGPAPHGGGAPAGGPVGGHGRGDMR
ncbi:MAG: DUF6600 domain-containing protein [Xanthobacteraceae bacterium]